MKTVKVDCSPNPLKVISVEIPDGSRWIHGDKTETTEINGKKYRIIKVIQKGAWIGTINRMTGKFEDIEPCSITDESPIPLGDKPLPPGDLTDLAKECYEVEAPYRQQPITEEEIKKIEKPDVPEPAGPIKSCCCKPVGPQEPVEVKEGKIKSFFKKIFGKK